MIPTSVIIGLITKHGSDLLSFLKRHWRITLEFAAAIWIIVCCLTHCNPKTQTQYKEQPPQTIDVVAPNIPVPAVIDKPIQIKPWQVTTDRPTETADSIKYLLEVTDWLQNRLYQCDSSYTDDTATREYADEFETDSAKVSYSLVIAGRLQDPPRFSFTPKWNQPIELVQPRGIYLEGSIGPMMSYGDKIRLQTIRGELGIGIFNRKGWSYGLKGGASQIGWDVQATVRKGFSINLSKKR